ncbi:FUSC family protein [Dongia soli]|uniref:FUSC family protein n=1 Tax=Dongia soli TaxID=600628 RepID=A0ABU5EB37_9PROT|nr:FUSC family protein [Dongia soli]MDY0882785.1 FUSC family protein [Dongia soli]
MSLLRPLGFGWSHAVSTTVAVIVALYVAYALQLESPYSAATTVLVVASPIHGMVLAKSVYRFLGTLVGAIASIALVALFAQTPELFILGASLWVGIFTAISSLMRRFRAYGAVLAGYTVTLVALGAVDQPLQIFDLAMARIAVVTIGVVCSAVVTIILLPNAGNADLPGKLRDAVRGVAGLVRLAMSNTSDDVFATYRRDIAQKVQALDTALYAASAESAAVAAKSGYMRRAIAALFGLIAAASSLHQSSAVRRVMQDAPAVPDEEAHPVPELTVILRDLFDRSCKLFSAFAADQDQPDRHWKHQIASLREGCTAFQSNDLLVNNEKAFDAMIVLNRLDDLLDQAVILGENLQAYEDKSAKPIDIRLPYHLDWLTALINGFRGMLAVLLLGAIWIYTAWPNGSELFSVTIPFCTLLAASDRQQADATAMFNGAFIAAIVAFVCMFGLMTQITGFPLLALTISPFILVGGYYQTRPSTAMAATGFLIFFMTFLAPRNPMEFDMSAFLNSSFAFVFGAACVVPIFRVVFPQNHWRSALKVAGEMRRSLAQTAGNSNASRLWRWEYLAQDRLASIGMRLPLSDRRRQKLINGGFATVRIGREMARARSLLADLALDEETHQKLRRAFRAVRNVERQPKAAGAALSQAADRLYFFVRESPVQQNENGRLLRAIGSLRECADLISQNGDFFAASKWRREAAI